MAVPITNTENSSTELLTKPEFVLTKRCTHFPNSVFLTVPSHKTEWIEFIKSIWLLLYSAGLRLGEVTNLRLRDLQPENNRIFVRNGKGGKDRCTILSPVVWEKLNIYINKDQPVDWLFEGHTGNKYAEPKYIHILLR